jgi:DNA-binding NtrC family response regulator
MSQAPGPNVTARAGDGGSAGLVLVVDDEAAWLSSLERLLRPDGHRIALLADPAGVAPWLRESALDVVLLDLGLGAANGTDLLDVIARERPDLEVVVMTGSATIQNAVACMRRGAFDYLAKPFEDVAAVRRTVRSAVTRRRRTRERECLPGSDESPEAHLPLSLDAYERRALERALDETRGDATAAARRLGIGRSTLYRKLQKHGLGARSSRVGRSDPIR